MPKIQFVRVFSLELSCNGALGHAAVCLATGNAQELAVAGMLFVFHPGLTYIPRLPPPPWCPLISWSSVSLGGYLMSRQSPPAVKALFIFHKTLDLTCTNSRRGGFSHSVLLFSAPELNVKKLCACLHPIVIKLFFIAFQETCNTINGIQCLQAELLATCYRSRCGA